MVKQYVYIDTKAANTSDLVTIINNDRIRININGLLSALPPYALISLHQLEYITATEVNTGLIMMFSGDAANQLNLNKTDSVIGLCKFDYTKGTNYHYIESVNPMQTMISGNIQQLEFYFVDSEGTILDFVDVSFATVLQIETPDVGEPANEYRKAIPL